MNSIVIASKLESLRKCLDRIELKKPQNLEDLIRDIDTQDIIALNLERSVQLCVDIANHILSSLDDSPAMSMAESFERLSAKEIIPLELARNLRRAVGFRNLSVHAYDKIDWQLVWNILEGDLMDLVRYLECVESFDG
ncbi:DUF86 domain-containing protein [Opitutales bacterium]|nr:DUF86 domain-containing protein [Opitutales bacterium]